MIPHRPKLALGAMVGAVVMLPAAYQVLVYGVGSDLEWLWTVLLCAVGALAGAVLSNRYHRPSFQRNSEGTLPRHSWGRGTAQAPRSKSSRTTD